MDTVLGHTKAEIATSSGPGIQISWVLTSLTTIDSSGCNVITNTHIITHYTAARVDAGSVASDIGIGHRACHFLDIWGVVHFCTLVTLTLTLTLTLT